MIGANDRMIAFYPVEGKAGLQSQRLGKRRAGERLVTVQSRDGREAAPSRSEIRFDLHGAPLELHRLG